jgi:hypothetical protein
MASVRENRAPLNNCFAEAHVSITKRARDTVVLAITPAKAGRFVWMELVASLAKTAAKRHVVTPV